MLSKISTWSEWKHDMIFNFWIICTTWLISMNIFFDFWMTCITWLVTPTFLHQPNRTHCISKPTSKIQPTHSWSILLLSAHTINIQQKEQTQFQWWQWWQSCTLASNQHQLLVPKGMNCTPRYQVDYAYARGMLIMHKPWNKHNTLEHN